MTLILNIVFAWIAIISAILLSVIWLIRLTQRKMPKGPKKDKLIGINKNLRKKHIDLGYLFLLSSFLHGMLSSFSLMSLNYGTITLIIGLIIWYTYIDKANLGKKWMQYHRELTLILLIGTIIHIVEVGGFIGIEKLLSNLKTTTKTEQQIENVKVEYKDGTYEGIGEGYRPGLKVEVTIKDGQINEILIKEHNEVGQRFYTPAFDTVPNDIIEKQTTQVDTITGATYTSKGIIEAVEDALSKATK